jgi:hypothetical protein
MRDRSGKVRKNQWAEKERDNTSPARSTKCKDGEMAVSTVRQMFCLPVDNVSRRTTMRIHGAPCVRIVADSKTAKGKKMVDGTRKCCLVLAIRVLNPIKTPMFITS